MKFQPLLSPADTYFVTPTFDIEHGGIIHQDHVAATIVREDGSVIRVGNHRVSRNPYILIEAALPRLEAKCRFYRAALADVKGEVTDVEPKRLAPWVEGAPAGTPQAAPL